MNIYHEIAFKKISYVYFLQALLTDTKNFMFFQAKLEVHHLSPFSCYIRITMCVATHASALDEEGTVNFSV